MHVFELVDIGIWAAVPCVLAMGLPFWWAIKHPGGRVDRVLERIIP